MSELLEVKKKKKKNTIRDPAGWDPINDWTLGLTLLGWLTWDKNLNEEAAEISFWGHGSARNGRICPQHWKCPSSAPEWGRGGGAWLFKPCVLSSWRRQREGKGK